MSEEQNQNAPTSQPPDCPISDEEVEILTKYYDKNHDGKLSPEEIYSLVQDYKNKKIEDPRIQHLVEKYDKDHDGVIEDIELIAMGRDLTKIGDTNFRWAGYSAGFARAFRYLAFTSDFGEALRPVVSARLVNASYAVAIGYCFADVGWEAYKAKERGFLNEKKQPVTMTQVIVERSVFQGIASIAGPFLVIHTSVDMSKKLFAKLGRFQKWGPSVVGLCAIPFLPIFLDEPVERALEWTFERYGPWAHHKKD